MDMEKSCVLGLDLLSGSPLSRRERPFYSVVYLCKDESEVKEWVKVTLARVLRLAWELKPRLIAVDSLEELASDRKAIIKIAELLPPETQIVMVNLDKEGMPRKLREIAKEHGVLKESKKLSSLETAYLLAILAQKGQGIPVVKKDEVTKIIIRRARVEGKGGMSSNRFKRKVRGVVKQLAKEVQSQLQKNNFDFETYYKKSVGGLEKAVFVVYAPVWDVERVVSTRSLQDAYVEIRPVVRLSTQEELEEKQPVIVGLDPGYNFGIAIMDLDGNILFVDTIREANRAEIIDIIRKFGKCVIIATDVYPIPETVKKIASNLKAKVYSPGQQAETSFKRELVASYIENRNLNVKDNHSRDALAAALLAYREVKRKFAEAESYLHKTGLNLPLRKVWMRVASGMSIANAIEEVIDSMLMSEERAISVTKTSEEESERAKKLLTLLERTRLEKELLEKELGKKDKIIEELYTELRNRPISVDNKTITERKEEQLYSSLSALSNKLRESEERLHAETQYRMYIVEKLSNIALKKLIAIPPCSSLFQGHEHGSVKAEYCYVNRLSDLKAPLLSKFKIKAVISINDTTCENKDVLYDLGIGVLCDVVGKYGCEELEGKALLCDSSMLSIINEETERAREIAAERERARILRLLMEYRSKTERNEIT